MSNYLAIATVTAALGQLIQASIEADVFGARVTTVRPDAAGNDASQTKVNVYLYQITPNASFRSDDLPTRRADGSLVQRPRVALDLHYLLTFYGEELDLIPQRLLGSVVRTLHSEPMLTRQRIRDTISSSTFSFLADSTLADDVELVKFTPLPLSLEELSKLWSVLLQTPYALSVTYQGTVVLIESQVTPRRVLPVQERRLYALPFNQPIIEKITSQLPAGQPIVAGSTISILGKHLQDDPASTQVLVRVAGHEVVPTNGDVSNSRISVQLPDILPAGVQAVQIIQKLLLGKPAQPHNGFESNVVPFVLQPSIKAINPENIQDNGNAGISGNVKIQVDLQVSSKQRAALRLFNETPNGVVPVHSFLADTLTADGDTLTFPINGVNAGTYLVRVMIDGAESVLDKDKQKNQLTLP